MDMGKKNAAALALLVLSSIPAVACSERMPFISQMADTAIAAAGAARGPSCAWEKERAEDLARSALRELRIEGEGCGAEWQALLDRLAAARFQYEPNAEDFDLLARCER